MRMQSDNGSDAGSPTGYGSSDCLTHVVLVTEELQSYSEGSKELVGLIEMKRATSIEQDVCQECKVQ